MKLNKEAILSVFGISVLMVATSCSLQSERRTAAVADDPLNAAWQFAYAITNDPADRAECQDRVAQAYLARGDYTTALKLGEQITDWHKGVVLAEVAASLAEIGKTSVAMTLVTQAEAIARPIEDWQRDRIRVRAVKAKALLGQEEDAGRISQFYQGNQDYRAEVTAYHALSLARAGQITNAFEVLTSQAGTTNLDLSGWRAKGYLLLANAGHLNAAQASNAFAQGWASSAPGWQNVQVQMSLVESVAACGDRAQARMWLDSVSSNVLTGPVPTHIRPQLLCQLGIQWSMLGETQRVDECVQVAEPLIRKLQNIDQPVLFALLGEACVRLGSEQRGLTYYGQALEMAGQLTNRRPRAMACVDICLSLERTRLRTKLLGERVNLLLLGFGADHG